MEFRLAKPQDAGLIRDLVRAAYARWVPIIGREPQPMKADYERATQEHQIDMLYVSGTLVGLIETMLHSDHLWIENVAVRPGCQGQGLGLRLLAFAESKAIEAGRTELRLLTNDAFASNVALYSRVGYSVDRREPFMGGTTVYMSKKLAPAPDSRERHADSKSLQAKQT
ncbi:GNAT family N-acetyltransferase [Mesorhizobium sp. AR10]|uniref:GNAT family N-acetyltransferase n=1 Tax=Mesorhizobium sp. AR10 TaxID=2865839 RepID=UPI00215E0B6F|nr:GNAT family N-acetyltransferase [Mesorhizobium sp. AR10]